MSRVALGAIAAITVASGGLALGSIVQETAGRRAPAAQKASAPPPMQVRTHVNRTAAWVGDSIEWTVELLLAPTVDVIEDDLAGEKLALVGLELVGAETERTTSADGALTHRVRYRLSAFDVAETDLRIAPLTVRYYARRPGQRAEDLQPAGEVVVPGTTLAWRSTIPSRLRVIDLRQDRAPQPAPEALRWARPVGLGLLVASAAPVLLWVAGRARELRRPRERRPTLRASRRETRDALKSLATAETSTAEELRAAYARLNDVLRRYVAETTGVPAAALTPEEIAARLNGRRMRPDAETLREILAECDQACYGPPDTIPTSERFRDSLASVERMV
jgi:hypothetical protein